MADYVCRRLILFLDGTWNEDTETRPATNIVYLRERLFWGLQVRRREQYPADHEEFEKLNDFKKRGMSGLVFDGFEYIVYYDIGVGTGPYLDPLKGGIFGDGLDQKIREAYRFLSYWYRPGDEIFIFGFSRGAYTARSLAGYLQAIGLLRGEHCTDENEQRAWKYYRTSPGNRLSGEFAWFRKGPDPLVHDDRYLRIRALAVFDTVGALGVPAQGFRRINHAKYEFHDTDVNSLVDIALHAVAIDESRHAFEPSMWTKPKFKLVEPRKSPIEQVWFAGVHADIGGGYVKWTQVDLELDGAGLSFTPLAWMLQRLKRLIVEVKPIADEPAGVTPTIPPRRNIPIPFYDADLLEPEDAVAAPDAPWYRDGRYKYKEALKKLIAAEQHKEWAAASVVRADAVRSINQLPRPNEQSPESAGRVPFADAIGEMVHVSTLERFNKAVTVDKGKMANIVDKIKALGATPSPLYRPTSLIAVIPYIAATYLRCHRLRPEWCDVVKPVFTWRELLVVDWSGEAFDPKVLADAERVLKLLPAPSDIGLTAMPEAMALILDPRVKDWPRSSDVPQPRPT
jgi:hypothetical protein